MSSYTHQDILKVSRILSESTLDAGIESTIADHLSSSNISGILTLFIQHSQTFYTSKDALDFFNLLIVLIHHVPANVQPTVIEALIQSMQAQPSQETELKIDILVKLYNHLPADSSLKVVVFKAMVSLATAADEFNLVQSFLKSLSTLIKDWKMDVAEQKSLYLFLMQKCPPMHAYSFAIRYLNLFTNKTASECLDQVVQTIKMSLSTPDIIHFEDLLECEAVCAHSSHPLFTFLGFFLKGDYLGYKAFVSQNPEFIKSHGMNEQVLKDKLRILAVANLSLKYMNKSLPYSIVAQALDISESDVEKWIISGKFKEKFLIFYSGSRRINARKNGSTIKDCFYF
jgi:translation initiation factor 3 subunit M